MITLTAPLPPAADPAPLSIEAGGLTRVIGPIISLSVLAVAISQFRHLDLRQVWSMVPASVSFWAVFATWYLCAPLADWVIFRRLWKIPASGFLALLFKLIGNDILIGYIGEVYFYDWARKRADLPGAPFGAVKDVAILSALAGNFLTLAMLVVAWPFASTLPLGGHRNELLLSIAIILGSSGALMIFRKRLFSLQRVELRFVAIAQCARILVSTGLAAVMWHLVLPDVAVSWWVLLATIRLLLSRLPFLPNKDLVFASAAILLIGHALDIAALMAMMAGLILSTHVLLGAGLLASDLARTGQPA